MADSDVRLVIVRNLVAGEDHAIVAVHLDDSWITLDNRWLALVKDVEMRRIIPLFVLDKDGVEQFALATMADARRATTPSKGATPAPVSLGL